jgi:phosphoribosyl 1,2-cyclic phosphodiesterase
VAVRIVPLASGSRGNATLVEMGSTRVLVDAGLSLRGLEERLAAVGVPPASLAALLLSHEHHDHAQGASRFSLRHRVPVGAVPETLAGLDLGPAHVAAWQPLETGCRLDVGAIRVEAFPVPHDARHPVGFVLEGEGVRVGIVTDLGHATTLVVERLRGCHVLFVESNHDDRMLLEGPYPWHLKQRVSGRMGHLSNVEAAALVERAAGPETRAVVLGHLSEKNNRPGLARDAASAALVRAGCRRVEMRVAPARHPGAALLL